MKNLLLVLSVLVLVSVSLAAPETGKAQIGGNFWFRYHLDHRDDSTQRSAFTVERGYLGVNYKWDERIDGQMTINVFSTPDMFSASDWTGWDWELRDAYLNLYYFVPDGKVRVGLQKNYFGTVYDWKYMTIRKSLADAVGVVSERDYGIAFLGWLPNSLGEWALGVMNGEGFSSGFNPPYADKQPGIMAAVRVVPITETTVGMSFLRDKRYVYPWDVEEARENRVGYKDRTAYSFMTKIGHGPFSILGEYLWYDYPIQERQDRTKATNVKGTGYTIFPMVRLTDKLEFVGRYDMWDPDRDSDTPIWEGEPDSAPTRWWLPRDWTNPAYHYVKHNVYVAGLNYNLTDRMEGEPGVFIQVNWQRIDPQEKMSEEQPDAVDSFIFQLRWGWGGLDF